MSNGKNSTSDVAAKFNGRWRIVEMDNWPNTYVRMIGEAFVSFGENAHGELAFGAVKGWLDVRHSIIDRQPLAEFYWEGYDEDDPVPGRGWLRIESTGRANGRIFIHCGEESGLICEPM